MNELRVLAVISLILILWIAYAAHNAKCDGVWISGRCVKSECVR